MKNGSNIFISRKVRRSKLSKQLNSGRNCKIPWENDNLGKMWWKNLHWILDWLLGRGKGVRHVEMRVFFKFESSWCWFSDLHVLSLLIIISSAACGFSAKRGQCANGHLRCSTPGLRKPSSRHASFPAICGCPVCPMDLIMIFFKIYKVTGIKGMWPCEFGRYGL